VNKLIIGFFYFENYSPWIRPTSCLLESKEELERRIYLYFDEFNQEPVVYHWSYKMDEISVTEAIEAGIKTNEVCNS